MIKIDKEEYDSLMEMFGNDLSEKWSYSRIASYYNYYFKRDWWKLWRRKAVLSMTRLWLPKRPEHRYYKREGI